MLINSKQSTDGWGLRHYQPEPKAEKIYVDAVGRTARVDTLWKMKQE